jgi:hypothetical protein
MYCYLATYAKYFEFVQPDSELSHRAFVIKDNDTGTWRLAEIRDGEEPEEIVFRGSGILLEKVLPPLSSGRCVLNFFI